MNVRSVLPRDAIPSIDAPTFREGYPGDPDDELIIVEGDPTRAYPIRILSYHEIVNDIVDGDPIAVTWCPICWSAIVYERTLNGRTLTFGTSGKLADDALVMYDRETRSEWKQPTGTAIAGELEGSTLGFRSSPIIPWWRFTAEYPDGVVLQPVRGVDSPTPEEPLDRYEMDPYRAYVDGDHFGLYGMRGIGTPRVWDRSDTGAKTVVLGIERDETAIGYPLPTVRAAGGVVADTVSDLDILVVAIDRFIQAFEQPGIEVEIDDGVLRGDDASWNPVTGVGTGSDDLARVPGRRLFAFAWQDAHGPHAFFEPPG